VAAIGEVGDKVKLAAGLYWADYAVLGDQVRELESAGVDWLHIEVRDGRYMKFGMPRGGFDILQATRASTSLPIEAQLQMYRPGFDVFRALKDLGVDLMTSRSGSGPGKGRPSRSSSSTSSTTSTSSNTSPGPISG
jgi:ribulose-phosphate 3-epimerase